MVDTTAHDLRTLQDCSGLLTQAIAQNMTAQELLRSISSDIAARTQWAMPQAKAAEPKVCPSCGKGQWMGRFREGVFYYTCVIDGEIGCGYSREVK